MKEAEKSLDSQLWHACAGGMVQMPSLNSKVFYFPQGHAEHAQSTVDFTPKLRIPPLIPCRVAAVKFLADSETDEVFAKMKLVPLQKNELDSADGNGDGSGSDNSEKPASFAKTLTQSDANNGGGFSVPRYCAETIFPRLDYTADPPVQTVIAKDVHGEVWKFRHIYRGTPRRHLLTTGWSTFVNKKKLVAGDSIVFLRDVNGDLCVGIRRAKRAIGGQFEPPIQSGWNSSGFSMFVKGEETKLMRNGYVNSSWSGNVKGLMGRVRAESVTEAAALAYGGEEFEVVYYPRASTPDFCVKVATVKAAMRIQWCSGMRFKMAFETEDSSRISWFMGTIASVQVADPVLWPNSPWRLLQVTWDEPDLLQNVKRVSPWLVELVSSVPVINLSPFSPPRKKLRVLQHPEFPLDGGQFLMSSFTSNPLGPSSPLCFVSDNTPAGIQGARHPQCGGLSLSDLHLNNKLNSGLFPSNLLHLPDHLHFKIPDRIIKNDVKSELTIGNSGENVAKKSDDVKKRHYFLLFGQPILTEQQISQTCSWRSSSDRNLELSNEGFSWCPGSQTTEHGLQTGHCKVFMESEDVGRTLDLSILGSYEELYKKLSNMFGIERSEMQSHVLYRDTTGAFRQTGNEPFSNFTKTAKRLVIITNSGNDHIGRAWIAGTRRTESGLDASNKTGPLSVFA